MAVRKLRGGSTGAEFPYSLQVVTLGAVNEAVTTTCIVQWSTSASVDSPASARKDRWPASLRIFKHAMTTALITHGIASAPSGSEGPTIQVVPHARVRSEFGAAYPADSDDPKARNSTKRKAFDRSLKSALERGLITSREIAGTVHLWFSAAGDERDTHTDKRDTP
jgi:hypothetical protein